MFTPGKATTRSTNNDVTSKFFFTVDTLTLRDLIRLADRAHVVRDFRRLFEIGRAIAELSPLRNIQGIASYYRGLAIRNIGFKNLALSTLHLEAAVNNAPRIFQSRSLLALSSNARQLGDERSELAYNTAVLTMRSDPWATFQSEVAIAVLRSRDRDHKGALRILESLSNQVIAASRARPETYYRWLNSLAVERLATAQTVTEFRAAERASILAVNSRYAKWYPEFSETHAELRRVLDRAVIIGDFFQPDAARVTFSVRQASMRTRGWKPGETLERKREIAYLTAAASDDSVTPQKVRRLCDAVSPDLKEQINALLNSTEDEGRLRRVISILSPDPRERLPRLLDNPNIPDARLREAIDLLDED